MEESSKVTPDLLSYSGVIACMAKSKRANDAEDILDRMTEVTGVEPDNGEKQHRGTRSCE